MIHDKLGEVSTQGRPPLAGRNQIYRAVYVVEFGHISKGHPEEVAMSGVCICFLLAHDSGL